MKPSQHTQIAKMRRERDVQAQELAEKLGVTPVHLSYVVNGHRKSEGLVRRAVAILSAMPVKNINR